MPVSLGGAPSPKSRGKAPQAGDAAPDLALTATDGSAILLSELWERRPIVVVFLRHYGCTFCREQAAWLRRDYAKFQAAGAEVVAIGQGDPKTGKAFQILLSLPYPLLVTGNDLAPYQAYGLDRGTFSQLFGWRSFVRGAIATLRGHFIGRLSGNGFQMPGTFVIDTGGRIQFVHRHAYASDNLSNDILLRELDKLSKPSAISPTPR
ncbi:MAG: alkyl hydroperoxide reductase/thiol specific antioxidant/Mal allergen [Capsulimonas sp.]|nr:alkyl hydroperoxide reductase/thiol specific antioxidant/Mal allergen [Capsulimonas sp.]